MIFIIRVRPGFAANVIAGLGVAGWINQAGYMAGMAQDILDIFAAQHLGGFITALPRGQVIVEGAGHKRIHCNITQVDGRIKHIQLAWLR
ncbi:MAG: hypothetical protein IIC63_08710, partial [Proteobacteria bacterium]|nr:hypothetical protein [Pseudomonadota bacterium]